MKARNWPAVLAMTRARHWPAVLAITARPRTGQVVTARALAELSRLYYTKLFYSSPDFCRFCDFIDVSFLNGLLMHILSKLVISVGFPPGVLLHWCVCFPVG